MDTPTEIEDVTNPRWSEAGRNHDWRNYVSEEIRGMWDTFSLAQKLALRRQADERAGYEHWD